MNIEKRKVYIIWVADFTDMQLINKFNKEFHFPLYVIDICSKYAQVVALKTTSVSQLLVLFKKFQMRLIANQTKHVQINVVNFTID